MQLAASLPYSESSTLSRVDRVMGRVFSIFAFSSLYEAWSPFQSNLPHLNSTFAWFNIALLTAALVYNLINFWFLEGKNHGYLIVALVVLFNTATWPLELAPDQTYEPHFMPWIWWITGLGPICIGIFIPRWWSWVYTAAMPLSWLSYTLLPGGGAHTLVQAILDALFIVLFPATLVGLAQLLRQSANRVDLAQLEANEVVVESAKLDAIEREHAKISGELHDSVISALEKVAMAASSADFTDARKAASQSIVDLVNSASDKAGSIVSADSFVKTLINAVDRQFPWLKVESFVHSEATLDSETVSVLVDATIQAVNNSIEHAGPRAQRRMKVRVNERLVKIVVNDDGVGFRVSRVGRSSVGLRWGIINRVEAVGGEVFIDSKPGSGTSIIIQFGFKK